MRFLLRLPLHYQIFIALVLGTIVGIIVNPGDVTLEAARVELEVTAEPVDAGRSIAVRVVDPLGRENLQKRFDALEGLQRWYPELAQEYARHDPPQSVTAQAAVDVAGRKFHIAEHGTGITITYTRRHNGRSVVTRYTAADAEELAQTHPQWTTLYAQHGGGLPRTVNTVSKAVGDLFLRLLRMVTIPLIVTSLITGVAGLGGTSRLGSMFGKTLLYYVGTSVLAITTGLLVVNLVNPGLGADLPGGGEGALVEGDQSLIGIFWGLITSMVPPNPIESLARGDFLSIITFSILVGVFIIRVGGRSGEILRDFFQAAFAIVMAMTMAIIRLAPIGVFAFMTYATASQGLEIFKTLAWYMLTVFLALLVHAAVVMPLILKFVARRSPWQYAKALSPALMTAFSTASSNGTLPLTMTCVEERAGVPNRVTSFVLPLGATINMDGTALYEAVAVLFIAQAYYGVVPLQSQILVAVTALMASVGAAGIPHAGLVMMAIVLQAVGLPLEAQGVIIAVDRVLDMCRTTVNVWSDSCGCAVLDRFEGTGGAPQPAPSPAPVPVPPATAD